ncbi:glycosyltransferase family 39 protein [Fibrella sp. HMF5036]|uniref:Glycosyltransferase family 39 protein n=2 Tax=Fibrella aquatilis TaxID=2817059 RepID=A0A939GAQ4_9BACT|nr:glycosyltransferase family 39 protein [Fibrella aquatilis]
MPLDTGDEARRALVSLEMILSGDYITPTLHGERYFNKPPLYNWLIVSSYWLFGTYSTFALRFPMLVSLVLLGVVMFRFVRRYVNATVAWSSALMMLTNGRVLLYDSMLGLIEITFALVTYLTMLLVYHYDQKQKYWLLYTTSYGLTAVGFLLKGLPSVLFLGLTLLAWCLYTRRLRLLLHPAHWAGMGLFLLLTGSYYVAYFSQNHISVQDVAGVLFHESAKRTGLYLGWLATVIHLGTFPAEVIYHLMPYSLLLVLLAQRNIGAVLQKNRFIAFNALTFGATILVYWLSPQVYGRYLIDLAPLLFTVLSYLYHSESAGANPRRFWIERSWLVLSGVVAVGIWTAVFYPATRSLPGVVWKTALLSGLLAALVWQMSRRDANQLLLIVGVLIVIRMGFNWLVLPGRAQKRQFYKDTATQAAQATLGHPLYSYKATVGADGATDLSAFHIAAVRREILRKTARKIPGAYYIGDSATLAFERYQTIGHLVLFDRHRASVVLFD